MLKAFSTNPWEALASVSVDLEGAMAFSHRVRVS